MMDLILENRRIDLIARNFLRPPHRLNDIHEADAELVDMGDQSEFLLAVTADALIEEVATGLYDDPSFIGWMLATANFSDLAAVGANPLGLLVMISTSPDHDETYLTRLAGGISEACHSLGTFVLGGDTNRGDTLTLSGCAIGLVPKNEILMRTGARPGDKVYLSGPAGLGAVYAFLRLSSRNTSPWNQFFKPTARIKEGRLIRKFASCAMDTSDGLIHTVDTLMRLNGCRFLLETRWEKTLHPAALEICRARHLPPWLALAAVHGEFELCFTIHPDKEKAFLAEAQKSGWLPIAIGEVTEGEGVSLKAAEKLIPLDTASIRNIAADAGADPKAYIESLFKIAGEVRF
jgi:thiamine-monophosphate kinase